MGDLTSWKEIAVALGVTVRTAQKWERERQLPVRRTTGGRIAADRAAIVAWQALLTKPVDTFYFRWPVGSGVFAEVRFIGAGVTPTHVELLRQYLELVKAALTDAAAP